MRPSGASTSSSVSPTNSIRFTPRTGAEASAGKNSRTPSQTMSSCARASTLESTVSIEAGPKAISAWASRSAASKLP